MSVRILSSVHRESVRIARYYDKRRPGLGAAFFDKYDEALEKIERNRFGYPRLESVETERDIRRVILNRFPYLLIYENIGEETIVIALRHVSQDPLRHIPDGEAKPRD